MRLAIVLAVLGLASPADAYCHVYRHWAYPFPQPHCTTGLVSHTTREADHSWYVEIVLPDADPARTQGVQELKTLLGR